MNGLRTALRTTVVLGVLALCTSPAKAQKDVIQLATNMIWCYQAQTRIQISVDAGDAAKLAASYFQVDIKNVPGFVFETLSMLYVRANVANVSHEWYARAIDLAVQQRSVPLLRGIYKACQLHNKRAMEYLEGATDDQVLWSGGHAVACYPSTHTGTKVPKGTFPCKGEFEG